MNMSPLSSRSVDMRPLSRAVKKVSGSWVRVCREVENLHMKGRFI